MRKVDCHRRLFPQESREREDLVARGSGKRQYVGVVPSDSCELVGLVRSSRAWRQSDQESDQDHETNRPPPRRLKPILSGRPESRSYSLSCQPSQQGQIPSGELESE